MTLNPDELGQSRNDLAETLRAMRKRAGRTQAWLAKRCNMSQTKISNIEGAKQTPGLVDVELILRALDAPAGVTAEMTALARIANTEWQDAWAQRRTGLEKKQNELAGLEQSSTDFRYFLLSMITGLLATPEYARASLAGIPGDHSKAIAKKLERQGVLYDTSKRFTFILTEQAVRWPYIPAPAMAMQLDRLISVSLLPSVRLGVIPTDGHKPICPLNTFTIYDARTTNTPPTEILPGRGWPNGPTSSAQEFYPTTEIISGLLPADPYAYHNRRRKSAEGVSDVRVACEQVQAGVMSAQRTEDCAECLRLAEQEQAAVLTGDRSRRTDVRVMWHRHITAVHAADEAGIQTPGAP